MILVLAPADLAKESPEPTAPIDASNDLTATNFADVDDLLAGLDAAAKPAPTKSPRAQRRPDPAHGAQPPVDADPGQANVTHQPWDNPTATVIRRRLGWMAAVVGGVLLLVAAMTAWTLRPSDSPVAAAIEDSNAEPANAPPSAESASSVADDLNNPKEKADELSEIIHAPPTSNGSTTSDDTSPVRAAPSLPDNAANSIASSLPPPIDDSTSPSPATTPATDTPRDASPLNAPSSNSTPEAPAASTPPFTSALKPVAAAESSLAALATLLEQSGSSIGQITDATAGRDSADSIGLPKYFFRTEKGRPIDPARQLQLPCNGIRCQQKPLTHILRDITRISGIPITLDLLNFPDTDTAAIIPVIDIDISDTDMDGAIKQCVLPLGLAATTTDSSVIIHAPDAMTAIQRTYELETLSDVDDLELERLSETINAMIGGDSWFVDADRFQIDQQDGQLLVTHLPRVHAQVAAFLKRASAAIALSRGASPSATHEATLQTRLGKSAAIRQLPCDLPITNRGTLDDLLDRVHDRSGVHIVANWQTLDRNGWTPLTLIPGDVTEPTLGELLNQLERSLNARAIIIDSATIELTTRDDALQRTEVEFYLIADLFGKGFVPERVLQLVQEAIAGSPGGRRSLIVYEPRYQSMVVSAPQTTHQTIESILAQIRRLDAKQNR